MPRAAPLPHQKDEKLARLSQAVKLNIDALESRCDAIEARAKVLEAHDAWFRETFYPYVQGLATFVGYAAPPALPR